MVKRDDVVRYNPLGLICLALSRTHITSHLHQVTAKRKLSEALTNRPRHIIIEGELYRQEQGALMKTWPKRYVILYDDCIEVPVNLYVDREVFALILSYFAGIFWRSSRCWRQKDF